MRISLWTQNLITSENRGFFAIDLLDSNYGICKLMDEQDTIRAVGDSFLCFGKKYRCNKLRKSNLNVYTISNTIMSVDNVVNK